MRIMSDWLRAFLVSPETLAAVTTAGICYYWPSAAEFVAQLMGADFKWSVGILGVQLAMLVGAYQIGTDILSPQGTRNIILDWPSYPMLKNRIVISIIFCALSLVASGAGLLLIRSAVSSLGTTLVIASLFVGSTAVTTVGLAKWKAREILRE